jgi:hypothetical protein
MMTIGNSEENVIDLTRGNKNGHFQSADKQSEKENDGQKHVLAANKTPVDAKANPKARAMASQSWWWESPEAHALFCDMKRSKGYDGNSIFP